MHSLLLFKAARSARLRWLGLLLSVWLGGTTLVAHAAGSVVLATVNGHPITRQEVIRAVPKAAQNTTLLEQSLQRYINTLLIYEDAKRQHLEREAKKTGVPAAELQSWLIKTAEQKWIAAHPITEQDINEQYRRFLATLPPHEWRLREILVAHRADAATVIKALREGRDFSVLAAKYSQDTNAALGGELGWVDPQKLDAAIRQAVRSLKPMQVVGPINIPKGLSIVQLLGVRVTPKPDLKAVRAGLKAQLTNQRIAAYSAELRKQAHIVYPANPK